MLREQPSIACRSLQSWPAAGMKGMTRALADAAAGAAAGAGPLAGVYDEIRQLPRKAAPRFRSTVFHNPADNRGARFAASDGSRG